ncbi:hypothetical protein ACOME3_004042 [Neoechinorhynchus agilis]
MPQQHKFDLRSHDDFIRFLKKFNTEMLVLGKIPDYSTLYISEPKEGESIFQAQTLSFSEEDCVETITQYIHCAAALNVLESVLSLLEEETDLSATPTTEHENATTNIESTESQSIQTSTISVAEVVLQPIVQTPQSHNSTLGNRRKSKKRSVKEDDDGFVNMLKCPLCEKTFNSIEALRVHFGPMHINESYKCNRENCFRIFNERRSRERHSMIPRDDVHLDSPKLRAEMELRNIITPSNKSKAKEELGKLIKIKPLEVLRLPKKSRKSSDAKESTESQSIQTSTISVAEVIIQPIVQTPQSHNSTLGNRRKSKKRSVKEDDDRFVNVLKCPLCEKTFNSIEALRVHFGPMHINESYKCNRENCSRIFNERRSRERHSANPRDDVHLDSPKLRAEMELRNIITPSNKSKAKEELDKLIKIKALEVLRLPKNSRKSSDAKEECEIHENNDPQNENANSNDEKDQ